MHEYGIASSLLRMVLARAAEAGASRVTSVEIRVGAAAGVEVDLLATAWRTVRVNTPCAAAELVIHRTPERWVCALCRTPIAEGSALHCESCDLAAVLEGGNELDLERFEVERP